MVKEYLQATGHNSSDKAVESWIRLSRVDLGGAKELMERIGSSPYKTIDVSEKRKYRLQTQAGKDITVEADSPQEAIESMSEDEVFITQVQRKDANVMVSLLNGQKKSVGYYLVQRKSSRAVAKEKENAAKQPTNEFALTGKEKEEQRSLIELYAKAHSHGNAELYKDYKNDVGYVVVLDNGTYYTIQKPDIETRFCFGYGMYANATQEEEDRAHKNAEYAKTNAKYFVDENMKGLKRWIEIFSSDDIDAYKYSYAGDDEEARQFVGVIALNKGMSLDEFAQSHGWKPGTHLNVTKLTEDEKQRMLRGYRIVAARMEQRLATYLKKYGLSKLNVWTYLVD